MPLQRVQHVVTGLLACGAALTGQKQFELQDLVKQATTSFVGKVVDIANEAVPGKPMAFTHVTFTVQRVLFDRSGSNITDRIELVFAGGQVDQRVIQVTGVPTFVLGEEAVVFAVHDGTRYSSPILGGDQGLLRITRDTRDGTAYPLLPGRRGIESVVRGSFVATAPVQAIQAGTVQWQEAPPQSGPVRTTTAPEPVPGSGAVTASSSDTATRRPARLATLDQVVEGVHALDVALPAACKQGGR